MKRTIKILAIAVFVMHSAAQFVAAGDLTPPPGPVAPTMKPLNEVEPRTPLTAQYVGSGGSSVFQIDQPGSYYLVGNLNVPAGKHGVYIHGSGVTLDLNGFAIIGAGGSLSGVTSADGAWHHDITVKNGSVESCGSNGVDLFAGLSCRVSDLTTYDNGGKGIAVTEALVENCTSFQNDIGFYDDGGASFIDCISSENTTGFSVTESFLESCTSTENNGIGFVIGAYSTIHNCLARYNFNQGIVCTNDCVISGNQCTYNGNSSAGIWVQGTMNRVEGNNITENGYGIYVEAGSNMIVRNTVGFCSVSRYYIVAGNHVGVIVMPSTNAALINGSTGGGLGSSDPNANFSN